MKIRSNSLVIALTLGALSGGMSATAFGQQGAAAPGAAPQSMPPMPAALQALNAPQAKLPGSPTAVTLPSFRKVTGPGAMFDSSPSQWPGRDMQHYKYVANEYFVSGVSDGQPYTTRLVIRQPADNKKFSGLVVAESMHPVGGAHAFEYDSVYVMDSGHITAEIATVGAQQFAQFNAERYKDIKVGPSQTSDMLAQIGALVRSSKGPLAGLPVRKMVLWGTSASSMILVNYLPAHKVYRTPEMKNIYDGFMPTSNGTTIAPVDVPMIQVPTQHEYGNVATAAQDSDEPGKQLRVYEFAGLGHLDARNNSKRFSQPDCVNPMTRFPLEAYMSVALHHLLQWVDKGIAPPRSDRVLMDMFVDNDGSLMALDQYGNAQGGVRNPYVDVPVTKYTARNTATPAGMANPRGFMGPALLCTLSVWETPMSPQKLREVYGSKDAYVRKFEQRLNELEQAGWSLPVYHDLILGDAKAVNF